MAKTLHITVRGKVATYAARDGYIVCGNGDYEVVFTFDAEWDDHPVKTARFVVNGRPIDVVFEGTTVAVPKFYNATQVSVGVYSGETKTTTAAVIPCQQSILCQGGTPEDPAPDVYGQIIDMINNGLGGGGASWPKPEQVTADTRITEAGWYYAHAGFVGLGGVLYTFGPFYYDPSMVPATVQDVVFVYAGHSARIIANRDGQIRLQTGTNTVNGTMVETAYADAGAIYEIRLAKLS